MAPGPDAQQNKNSDDLSKLSSALLAELCSMFDKFSKESQECVQGSISWDPLFGIDGIREKILTYVIYDNKQKISRQLVKNVRLVQKSWLSTATDLLKKCKDPLLTELILKDNGNENRKSLDQFNELFGSSTRLNDSFLPFKLTLGSEFFRDENYQSLSDCFTRLGSELVELEIVYPFDGGNMSVNFPPFRFPILRKLDFQFSGNVPKAEVNSSSFEDNKFGLWLLQSILNATENLQQLIIPFTVKDAAPVTFEFLRLPLTIVYLDLELKLKSETLERFFVRNTLPNLQYLSLQFHQKPFAKGLMYKILEQFRKSLVNFEVRGICTSGRRYPITYFRFPLMEKLENVYIYSTECELDSEQAQLTCLQECIPNLNRVNLEYQTEAMLKKWVENSKFEGVNELIVSVINAFVSEDQDNYYRSPSPEIMTQLTVAFPNVTVLTLHLNIGFVNVLGHLFGKMTTVENLSLKLHGRVQGSSSDLVDSTFTGLSLKLVGALKEDNVDILESVLVLTNGNPTSIRNLSELTTLTLWTKNESGQDSLASDLLFGQAFLKMPKLHNLKFHGKFKPSLKMQMRWKDQGRFIKYSA